MAGSARAGWWLRRPMIGLATCVLLGTGLGLYIPFQVESLMLLSVGLFLFVLVFPRRGFSNYCLLGLTGLAACLNANLRVWNPSERDLVPLMRKPSEYVALVGHTTADPQVEEGRLAGTRIYTFPFRVEGIRRRQHWQKASGDVRVRLTQPAGGPPPSFGDRWQFEGVLQRLDDGPAEDRFRLDTAPPAAVFLSGGHGPAWMAWCFHRRQVCREILGRGLGAYPEQAGVLSALLLGYREDLPEERSRDFSVTGTMHIFAISGTHVGVLAVFIILLLKSLGISRPHWILYLAPLLVLFTVSTGMAASAVRACIMAVTFWTAGLFERKPDALTALALAAVLILTASPVQLVDPGFVLSFVAVAGLILLYPAMVSILQGWEQPDPWQLQPEARGLTRLRAFAVKAISLVAASWAAWLVTTPLTAIYFNLFSPVALLANLLVIPAAGLIMLTGCLSLVIGSLSSLGAEIFNHANRVFISLLLWFIDLSARVPGGHFFTPTPSAWVTAGWYVSLAAGVRWAAYRRWVLPASVGACLLLAGVWYAQVSRQVFVDILDVGQGNAALVKLPGREGVLIDTGARYCANRVLWHLRRQGVSRLRALALSHADVEHVGAATEILAALPVDEIWCGPAAGRSPAYRQALKEALKQGLRVRRLSRGCIGSLPGGVEWEVLDPPEQESAREADAACLVLRVAREASSLLFMGDAGAGAETRLLRAPLEPSALVLVVGAHGDSSSSSEAWLQAVSPAAAVISVGSDNPFGHPSRELLARLAAHQIAVYRTDELGTLRLRFLPASGLQEPGDEYIALRPLQTHGRR